MLLSIFFMTFIIINGTIRVAGSVTIDGGNAATTLLIYNSTTIAPVIRFPGKLFFKFWKIYNIFICLRNLFIFFYFFIVGTRVTLENLTFKGGYTAIEARTASVTIKNCVIDSINKDDFVLEIYQSNSMHYFYISKKKKKKVFIYF